MMSLSESSSKIKWGINRSRCSCFPGLRAPKRLRSRIAECTKAFGKLLLRRQSLGRSPILKVVYQWFWPLVTREGPSTFSDEALEPDLESKRPKIWTSELMETYTSRIQEIVG